MTDGVRCTGCGAELTQEASPQGLCPACLLKLGLSDPNIPAGTAEPDEPHQPPGPIPPPGARPPEPPRPVKALHRERFRLRRVPWAMLAMASGAVLLVVLTVLVVLWIRPRPEAPVFHMTLTPAVEPEEFAVAPDGRRIAFTAAGDDGKTFLWIRAFDAIGEQMLAGTEDAAHPFWSPDSRFVGFFSKGKLKRIDAHHGGAQTLADAPDVPDAQGAAWSSDGDILFTSPSGSLSRVSANGGAVEPITANDRSETGMHRFPNFLPDPRRFLFSISGASAEHNGAYVGSLDSGEVRRITNNSTGPAAYANGRLLFVRDGLLMAQPFDFKAMELSGEAQPLPFADRIESFSVSQNGILAYRAGEESAAALAFMDRHGRRIGVVDNVDGVSQFSLSPDARSVAFSRLGDIFVADLSRGVVSRVTFDSTDDSFPMWSPDAGRIVFLSTRPEAGGIYQKEMNGGMETLVLKSPPGTFIQAIDSWSPDGKFITYTARDRSGKSSLWALSIGEREKPVSVPSNFSMRQGRISPDGRWLAYVSNESGRDEIYVRQFPTSEGRWQVSVHGGTNPRWSRDGHELFYVATDRMLMAATIEARDKSPELGIPRMLLQVPRNAYEIAPDGNFLFLQSSESARPSIQIVVNWASELR